MLSGPSKLRARTTWLLVIVAAHALLLDGLWRLTHRQAAATLVPPSTKVMLELPTLPDAPAQAQRTAPREPNAPDRKRRSLPPDTFAPAPPVGLAAPLPSEVVSAPLRLDDGVLRKAARESWPVGSARQMIDAQAARDGLSMLGKQDRLARSIDLAHKPSAQDIAQGRERALKRAACKPPQAVGGDSPGTSSTGGIGGDSRWTFTVRQSNDCPP